MYLMYVDESGDPGHGEHSSPHYILSGLIINANDWRRYLELIKEFRQTIKDAYGLNIRDELHASELIRINKITAYRKIRKSDRIDILKRFANEIPLIFSTAKVINVCLRKDEFTIATDFHQLAWSRLIARYDNYLKRAVQDNGIIIADDSCEMTIRVLLRRLRAGNPIVSDFTENLYNTRADNIIEDVLHRESKHSYYIQTVDVIAHLLYRKDFRKGI